MKMHYNYINMVFSMAMEGVKTERSGALLQRGRKRD